ncbi:polysaccharide pyruvyl transferase family protein [Muricoccus radiodurans]|uniref:polysaccharide pyruvyl transferase family protein n=1 Tax=Muricoccus radiodurans TaxID=2231721 RepID=UPI003CF3A846
MSVSEEQIVDDPVVGRASAGPAAKKARVGLLWKSENLGLYANADFESLFSGVGRNTGNLAFAYAVASHIRNPFTYMGWNTPAETLRKKADILVIPCANQLGKHSELGSFGQTLREAGLPIVAIGLGAQASDYEADVELSEGTLDWLRVIGAHRGNAPNNIYARGPYSRDQIGKLGLGGAMVGGCPSYFINPRINLGRRIQSRWRSGGLPRSISVAAGHQSWPQVRTIEHQLVSLMMDPVAPGQYVVQSMGDMLKLAREETATIDPAVLERLRKHIVPHYTREEFPAWCRNYARAYFDVPSWMDSLRRHDLTVGPRYHGTALALQAERMGLAITIDSRTRELCEQTSVPHIAASDLVGPLTRTTLREMIDFDGDRYDAHRRQAAGAYVDFLEANGIIPAPFLTKLALSAPAAAGD